MEYSRWSEELEESEEVLACMQRAKKKVSNDLI